MELEPRDVADQLDLAWRQWSSLDHSSEAALCAGARDEILRLRAELAAARDAKLSMKEAMDIHREATRLARDAALEEAAIIAKDYNDIAPVHIRALKGSKNG